jgi:cbb3-type cytochrome oxidase maturation protein
MEVLIYLVPIALGLGLIGLGAFLWALKTGQYDDLEGAAWRALMDDDEVDGTHTPQPSSPGQARP